MNDYFGTDGLLMKKVPGGEVRNSQLTMAEAVLDALDGCRTIMIEAGTGVGKSLAYLIPAVLWSLENSSRVLVSTYSKALQQQLMEKELPFLKENLEVDFDFSMAMGNANYLCRRRLNQYLEYDRFSSRKESVQAGKLASWAVKTKTGLRSEITFDILPEIWSRVCRESDICFRGKCPLLQECPFMKERALLRRSHIVVVNHHLFFANLAAGETILPNYDAVVFDEAHCIEEAALQHFGIEITSGRVRFLADNIYNPVTKRGFLSRVSGFDESDFSHLKELLMKLRDRSEFFFDTIALSFPSLPTRIKSPEWIVNTLSQPLRECARELLHLKDKSDSELEKSEFDAYIRRARDLASVADRLIRLEEPHFVYWVEGEKNGKPAVKGSSVNVGDALSRLLFNGSMPLILASATLASDGSFDFIKRALGVEESDDFILDSPFDYRKNALIYMPNDLPDPSGMNVDFELLSASKIAELARISGGRCLVLFTSYRHLNVVFESLSSMDTGLNILRQGDMSHSILVDTFRRTPNSVLLATSSFWQGIDLPGDDLKMVILAKLPFSAPDSPLEEAKSEFCRDNGGNPFMDISLPDAIIWLKQGFGRLIRTSLDRGVVAVLDKRIVTKSYGRKFIASLPKCRYTTRLGDVRLFLEEEGG